MGRYWCWCNAYYYLFKPMSELKLGLFFLTWFGFFTAVGPVIEPYGYVQWYIALALLIIGFGLAVFVYKQLSRWF